MIDNGTAEQPGSLKRYGERDVVRRLYQIVRQLENLTSELGSGNISMYRLIQQCNGDPEKVTKRLKGERSFSGGNTIIHHEPGWALKDLSPKK